MAWRLFLRFFASHAPPPEYQLSKRTTFENGIRRNRTSIGNWLAYAQWEASQNQFERARSVFERAIDQDYQNLVIWIKYAELEMKVRWRKDLKRATFTFFFFL